MPVHLDTTAIAIAAHHFAWLEAGEGTEIERAARKRVKDLLGALSPRERRRLGAAFAMLMVECRST